MEEEKKDIKESVNKETENLINLVLSEGIKAENVDLLGKLVDIHKDIANECYWEKKEDYMMRYRMYDGDSYDDGSYGRRGVPGTGRRRYR